MINMVGVRCVVAHGGLEVRRQDGAPGLVEVVSGDLDAFVLVFGDEQLLEEELVGQPADAGAALPVDVVAAADEVEGLVQGVLDAVVDQAGGGEDALSLGEFAGDAGLLLAGEVVGDGAGDDATDDPAALVLQLLDALAGGDHLRPGAAVLAVEFGAEPGADARLDLLGEPDLTPDTTLIAC